MIEPDICEYIANQFASHSAEAEKLLAEHTERHPDHAGRVSRCIVFLAKGSISELKRMMKIAHEDYRDVIFWAEYTDWGAANPPRIRNFSRPFGQEDEPSQ